MAQLIDIEHRSFEETLQRCADIGGADLLFFSPPYPTEVPGAKGREGAPTRRYGGDTPEHFLWEDYQRLGDCCYRALKPGGFCIVIVDGPIRTTNRAKGSERSLIAFELAIDWTRRVGFRFVEHEAYLRDGIPGKWPVRRRSGWEPMHVFQRAGAAGFFDPWAVHLPAIHTGLTRLSTIKARCYGRSSLVRAQRPSLYKQSNKKMYTTAICASPAGPTVSKDFSDIEHQAPFTKHIADVQVLSYSPPGGLVCDPFNGSGTTGIAAAKHGRSFVGGDLGARERDGRRWADIGRERALEAAGMPPDPRRDNPAPARPVVQQLGLLDVLG